MDIWLIDVGLVLILIGGLDELRNGQCEESTESAANVAANAVSQHGEV
jgi:hypothetical protein